jgi:hypothetical protein
MRKTISVHEAGADCHKGLDTHGYSRLLILLKEDFKHLSRKLTRAFLDLKGGEAAFQFVDETETQVEAYVDEFFLTRRTYQSQSKTRHVPAQSSQ